MKIMSQVVYLYVQKEEKQIFRNYSTSFRFHNVIETIMIYEQVERKWTSRRKLLETWPRFILCISRRQWHKHSFFLHFSHGTECERECERTWRVATKITSITRSSNINDIELFNHKKNESTTRTTQSEIFSQRLWHFF